MSCFERKDKDRTHNFEPINSGHPGCEIDNDGALLLVVLRDGIDLRVLYREAFPQPVFHTMELLFHVGVDGASLLEH